MAKETCLGAQQVYQGAKHASTHSYNI